MLNTCMLIIQFRHRAKGILLSRWHRRSDTVPPVGCFCSLIPQALVYPQILHTPLDSWRFLLLRSVLTEMLCKHVKVAPVTIQHERNKYSCGCCRLAMYNTHLSFITTCCWFQSFWSVMHKAVVTSWTGGRLSDSPASASVPASPDQLLSRNLTFFSVRELFWNWWFPHCGLAVGLRSGRPTAELKWFFKQDRKHSNRDKEVQARHCARKK